MNSLAELFTINSDIANTNTKYGIDRIVQAEICHLSIAPMAISTQFLSAK